MRPEQVHAEPTDLSVSSEWRALEQSSVVASVAVSHAGTIIAANKLFADLAGGGAALVGQPLQTLLVGPHVQRTWYKAQQNGGARAIELCLRDADGIERTLRGDVRTATTRDGDSLLWGLFVDTSEEQQLRKAMQRGARLEALGSLTSGVAHDFNNLLTVLVGNLSLVAEELRSHPDVFAKLKSARDAARRGADLIGQLLGFARRESIDVETIDPGRVVARLSELLQRALGSSVELDTELEPGAGPILGNVALLESVIVNLTVNARDAVGPKGKVTISVADVRMAEAQAAQRKISAGQYVEITVADNGSGIAQENLQRVFEPFFSTKRDNGGTGLGLSMVRSYAEQAGGTVFVESTLGAGTSVSLLLPHSTDSLEETSAGTMPLSTLPTGDEDVLVLAFDESLCGTIRQILEVLGYAVTLTRDNQAFLRQCEDVDLVIVDAALAAQWGADEQIQRRMSDKRVIVLTTGGRLEEIPGAKVLAKPFSLADLAATVRATLDD